MQQRKLIHLYTLTLITLSIVCNIALAQKAKPSNAKKYELLSSANWLLGNWENKMQRGTLVEMWHQQNDSTYAGKSYFVAGKDTLESETISLQQRNGKLYYVPTVKNQNNGEAVRFAKLTTGTDLIFENPEHDFPQKISYRQVGADSLLAEISGMSKGKMRVQKFPMARVRK